MRLIVACPKCRRQYHAPGRKPGARFRCVCGAEVSVPKPAAHDARVVRCSSCGAPREKDSSHCRFCGADFTLHERDLHTMCPGCLARVSDQARFCHSCGVRIMPELVAGAETRMKCPGCGTGARLTSRRIGDTAVMECGRCAGLWLETGTFDRLTRQAADKALDVEETFGRSGLASPPRPWDGPRRLTYRTCPVCGQLMHRRNFGRRSGVIIDVCRRHGAWFDAEELPRILRWVRSGGLVRAQEERARQAAEQERRGRLLRTGREAPPPGPEDQPSVSFDLPLAVAGLVARLFLR